MMRPDDAVARVFAFYEARESEDKVEYYGDPLVPEPELLHTLREEVGGDYQFTLDTDYGETVLRIQREEAEEENITINVALAILTIITTTVMGAGMYGVNPLENPLLVYRGVPFSAAIMGVLGAHEFGHYYVAKYHGLRTSLPYFIPFPSIIGTLGAFIKHRGQIPDRKALFDVGVAGPLVGLIASIIVTVIGLNLPAPDMVQQAGTTMLILGDPPLFKLLSMFYPQGEILHPIAFAGWVGMFVTMLNLIPAGQLDGGHVLRAMTGEHAQYASTLVPISVVGLGLYVTFILNAEGGIWVFWGIVLSFFSLAGPAQPVNDEDQLGYRRLALGILIFILGALCFTPTPFTLMN